MLTTDHAGLIAAARAGDEVALLAWADALEEAGRREDAEALRGVPGLAVEIQAAGAACPAPPREGQSNFLRIHLPRGWQWCRTDGMSYSHDYGEEFGSADSPLAHFLLTRWDEMHPAAEFLFRRLNRPLGHVGLDRCDRNFDLDEASLEPFPGLSIHAVILGHTSPYGDIP